MDERVRPETFWPRLSAALAEVPAGEQTPPVDARAGAVLVLLADTGAGPSLVLTRRRRDMRSHPGQISFPGGRIDAGETVEQAALREAQEEVALRPETVEVVGIGPRFHIPPSRFWVVPVVGRWRRPHVLTENPWEVDEVLHVPLSQLLDRDRWRHTPLSIRGSAWAWQLDDDLLWGATAIVIARLLDVCIEDWHGGMTPHELDEQWAVRPWESAPAWQRRAVLQGELPAVEQSRVPHVTREQTLAVRAWLDERGVGPLARAEHAGRAVAHAIRRLSGGELADLRVTVLAGPSSNGAGGLAGARLLASAGADVEVVTVGEPRHPDQVRMLGDCGIRLAAMGDHGPADGSSPGEVVVDAVLGPGAVPPLGGSAAAAAHWLQHHDVRVVALDLPSGLSADHGLEGVLMACDVTLALGLPAAGLEPRVVHAYVGDLYLADLGIPSAAWKAAGVTVDEALFARGPLVRLTTDEQATDAGTPDQGPAPSA